MGRKILKLVEEEGNITFYNLEYYKLEKNGLNGYELYKINNKWKDEEVKKFIKFLSARAFEIIKI